MPARNISSSCRGFTLVEMIIFILVLSVALTGVSLVIQRTVLQSPQYIIQTRALELAQAYLDEVLAKKYDHNSGQGGLPPCDAPVAAYPQSQPCTNSLGPEGVEILAGNRNLFDDVDDYASLNESPPKSVNGTVHTGYTDYAVQIDVVYAGNELGLANNRLAKRVTVNITTPSGNVVPVSVYRTNF